MNTRAIKLSDELQIRIAEANRRTHQTNSELRRHALVAYLARKGAAHGGALALDPGGAI